MAAARRLSAWLCRWLTAAASPHTSLSFALPFETSRHLGTVNGHRSRARRAALRHAQSATSFCHLERFCHLKPFCHLVSASCHLAGWPLHVPHPAPPTRRRAGGGSADPPPATLGLASRAHRAPYCPPPLLLLHYSTIRVRGYEYDNQDKNRKMILMVDLRRGSTRNGHHPRSPADSGWHAERPCTVWAVAQSACAFCTAHCARPSRPRRSKPH